MKIISFVSIFILLWASISAQNNSTSCFKTKSKYITKATDSTLIYVFDNDTLIVNYIHLNLMKNPFKSVGYYIDKYYKVRILDDIFFKIGDTIPKKITDLANYVPDTIERINDTTFKACFAIDSVRECAVVYIPANALITSDFKIKKKKGEVLIHFDKESQLFWVEIITISEKCNFYLWSYNENGIKREHVISFIKSLTLSI